MRHGKKINHLSRKSAHRKALLSNMAISLITHKRITTTLAKAKALRKYVEPLVTRAKSGEVHDYRTAFRYLQNKEAIKELFQVVGPKVGARPGGYTRIIKLVNRRSDNAEMAIIELVDFNETMTSASNSSGESSAKKKKTRRKRSKKAANSEAVAETSAEAVADIQEVVEDVAETTEEVVAETQETATEAPADDAAEEADSNDEDKA